MIGGRTFEEIDASYREKCARFEEAKTNFENALARKLVQFATVNGIHDIDDETMKRAVIGGWKVPDKEAENVVQNGVVLQKNERKRICNCGPEAKAHIRGPDCK